MAAHVCSAANTFRDYRHPFEKIEQTREEDVNMFQPCAHDTCHALNKVTNKSQDIVLHLWLGVSFLHIRFSVFQSALWRAGCAVVQ